MRFWTWSLRTLIFRIIAGLIVLFFAIQLVPYGRDHTNPPVVAEPQWVSSTVRDLTKRACFDCHSNETVWPWYASVAPISWLSVYDVEKGRDELNFSEWGVREQETDEIVESLDEGMPPWFYLVLHPEARLDDAEMAVLRSGLAATFPQRDHDNHD